AVLALLEPEESAEGEPAGVAGEAADALGPPRLDARSLGFPVHGWLRASGGAFRRRRGECHGERQRERRGGERPRPARRGGTGSSLRIAPDASPCARPSARAFYVNPRARESPRARRRSPARARAGLPRTVRGAGSGCCAGR